MAREGAQHGRAEVTYSKSTDFGETWATEIFLSSLDTLVSDLAHLASDNMGNVYVVWRDAKYGSSTGFGASIILRRSTDHGQSWLSEQLLTSTPSGLAPRIDVSGNYVCVVWQNEVFVGGSEVKQIHCRASFDRGATWSQEYNITPKTDHNLTPVVAVTQENVHVAWLDQSAGQNLDIFYRRGRFTVTSVAAGSGIHGCEASLCQNYPNPFNANTQFTFFLPEGGKVTLEIYDLLGRHLTTLVTGTFDSGGLFTVPWEARGVSSGLYIARLLVQDKFMYRKVQLIK
jgi:Neuraminidase (sialidase)